MTTPGLLVAGVAVAGGLAALDHLASAVVPPARVLPERSVPALPPDPGQRAHERCWVPR